MRRRWSASPAAGRTSEIPWPSSAHSELNCSGLPSSAPTGRRCVDRTCFCGRSRTRTRSPSTRYRTCLTATPRSGPTSPTAPTRAPSNCAGRSHGRRRSMTACTSRSWSSAKSAPWVGRHTCASSPSSAWSRSATSGSLPALQRTTAATEAIFLLARHVFDDLGYRRLEWKCNALNAASRRAAERYGFSLEGVFRKHQVIKGRNRDSAWYAITDDEWPAIRVGFERWLHPQNFDANGEQLRSLRETIAEARRDAGRRPAGDA